MSDERAGMLGLRGADLHAGPDLANALARSAGPPARSGAQSSTLRESAAPARLSRAAAALVAEALNAPAFRVLPAAVLVTGTERVSGSPMRLLFRGQLRCVDFCAAQILGTPDFERGPAGSPRPDHDVLVADHPLVDRAGLAPRPALRVPQWVRQRVALGDEWPRTVENIPASLSKRIARTLGGAAYTVRIEPEAQAKEAFYDGLYLPYVRHRFGPAAIVPGRSLFLAQARDGVLLELVLGERRVGAALLGRRHDTAFIGKSALSLDDSRPYRFDLLDYFCLLAAQLSGCRYVDFGVSRAHLDDGVFANKAKWRPELVPAGGLKSSIRIRPVRASAATAGFLERNGFIERRGERFVVRRLHGDAPPDAADAAEAGELARRSGLDTLIIAYAGGGEVPAPLSAHAPFPRLQRLDSAAGVLEAFLRHA